MKEREWRKLTFKCLLLLLSVMAVCIVYSCQAAGGDGSKVKAGQEYDTSYMTHESRNDIKKNNSRYSGILKLRKLSGKVIVIDCLFVTEDASGGTKSNYAKLMDALISGEPLTATWATVKNFDTANAAGGDDDGHIFNKRRKAENADDLYWGKVVVTSVSLTADNGSLSTYSVSMAGKGAINKGKNNKS